MWSTWGASPWEGKSGAEVGIVNRKVARRANIPPWSELLQRKKSYVCLLDIAKAFPSTPHPSILEALRIIGTPPNLLNMISSIYHSSSNQYHDFQYPLRRGIKEGCPLSPSLFILVYEAFHATLTREFPTARFFVYVDDIAVVTSNKATLRMRRVLHRTHEFSMSLDFRINHSKTEIYRWAPHHKCASITWQGNRIKILAPVFKYLGHHLAHPNFLGRAQTELMSQVTSDLSRYQHLPLDAFERAQLLSLVLFPKWCYTSLFIPHDRMFYDIDQKARIFVTAAKGIEPRHNVTHITKADWGCTKSIGPIAHDTSPCFSVRSAHPTLPSASWLPSQCPNLWHPSGIMSRC